MAVSRAPAETRLRWSSPSLSTLMYALEVQLGSSSSSARSSRRAPSPSVEELEDDDDEEEEEEEEKEGEDEDDREEEDERLSSSSQTSTSSRRTIHRRCDGDGGPSPFPTIARPGGARLRAAHGRRRQTTPLEDGDLEPTTRTDVVRPLPIIRIGDAHEHAEPSLFMFISPILFSNAQLKLGS